ncbi:unnamed protein product, partial [marine sediment metagenome]
PEEKDLLDNGGNELLLGEEARRESQQIPFISIPSLRRIWVRNFAS